METPKKKSKMVYATRYALTKGIEYIQVLETSIPYLVQENTKYPRSFLKGDYFDCKEDAVKKAEEMRIKKLKSLDNQIKKLSKLKFD